MIQLFAIWLWSAWLFTVAVFVYRRTKTNNFDIGWDKISASAVPVDPAVAWLYGTGGSMMLAVIISGCIGGAIYTPVLISRLLGTSPDGYKETPFHEGKPTSMFPVVVYCPVYLIARVIKNCADASTKVGEERIHAISNIPFQPALTDINKTGRMRGTIPHSATGAGVYAIMPHASSRE
ncbi:hypothetical protein [Streptomyces sp. NPDC058486]|uniref:hypothetical protein n=1 Tax=unclassified Streptomyces TaxID=2593676 RepID=UPI0036530102